MMDRQLSLRLESVHRRSRRLATLRRLAAGWAMLTLLAVAGLALVRAWGVPEGSVFGLLALGGVGVVVNAVFRWQQSPRDYRDLARRVEERFPELDGRLLTAVQQVGDDGRALSYLQRRVLREALDHGARETWGAAVPRAGLRAAHLMQAGGLVCFAIALWLLRPAPGAPVQFGWRSGVTVTPGDTTLERGSSLVVLARFDGAVPAQADLAIGADPANLWRTPLTRALADPVFGGSVPEVTTNFTYWVEYAGSRTREFRVAVFEYPRLERADVDLESPAYTGLARKRIAETRRVSALEGTRLDLGLQFNKPVASATLVPRARGLQPVALDVATNGPTAALNRFNLAASATYDLRLVDRDGRTNKTPAVFVFEALTNRTPELKLATPRGDIRPSALEEVAFNGTVWDDFGVAAYGLAYTVVGGDTVVRELGRSVPAKEKRPFDYLLRFEDLGVTPDQLVSWYVWADDAGPDGQPRRTASDLYFGEVRPFDEVFRENTGGTRSEREAGQTPGESSGEQGSRPARLAELQKQIVSATWRLDREHRAGASEPYVKDATVVRDSQAQALGQAEETGRDASDLRSAALWQSVTTQMRLALERLDEALKSTVPLPEALKAEQAAYQALLKLRERELEVSRGRTRDRNQRGNSAGDSQRQQQLDQLELAQSENRYETERQARAPQSSERSEQLQVLNRLQELARRQQAVNERLQELQTALEAARSESERDEIRRQLKRLQEEEQRLVSDADELQQRMDRPENQSALASDRRRLEETRNDMQRAGQAVSAGAVSQALAAGTRAQEQLQEMRDEVRRRNSSAFAEDLRQMRLEARDLVRQQDDLARQLDELIAPTNKTLRSAVDRPALADQAARQEQRLTNLVDRAAQLSRQAEASEPLVSRQIHDTLRALSQDERQVARQLQDDLLGRGLMSRSLYERFLELDQQDAGQALDLTAEMLRRGFLPQADAVEERARTGVNRLRRGVERAAESVIGDDAEALRRAEAELAALTAEVEQEMAGGEQRADAGRRQLAEAGSRPERTSAREGRAGSRPSADAGGGSAGTNAVPDLDALLNRGGRGGTGLEADGVLFGEDYGPWSDRLREVEELIEEPGLRDDVAAARERARLLRQGVKRDAKKPDWAVVRLEVVKPLVEVRNRVRDELARREPSEALVPIDRDPVPSRFSELVRRYYEDLGRERSKSTP